MSCPPFSSSFALPAHRSDHKSSKDAPRQPQSSPFRCQSRIILHFVVPCHAAFAEAQPLYLKPLTESELAPAPQSNPSPTQTPKANSLDKVRQSTHNDIKVRIELQNQTFGDGNGHDRRRDVSAEFHPVLLQVDEKGSDEVAQCW